MENELQIIYSILQTVRGTELNNDETISERLIRAFILKHRPDILRKHYINGHVLNDEVFQIVPIILTKQTEILFKAQLPKVVHFDHSYGINIAFNGIVFGILSYEEFYLTIRNNKKNFFPLCYISQDQIYFYIGKKDSKAFSQSSETAYAINSFYTSIYNQELSNYNNPIQAPVQLNLDLRAVLVNPDDQIGYSFESSIFPFPAERLPELEQTILAKEFNIILQTKKDEVQNARQDSIRYHDNENVEN